jgi:hypothetical protein
MMLICYTLEIQLNFAQKFLVARGYTVFLCSEMEAGVTYRKEICEYVLICLISYLNKYCLNINLLTYCIKGLRPIVPYLLL